MRHFIRRNVLENSHFWVLDVNIFEKEKNRERLLDYVIIIHFVLLFDFVSAASPADVSQYSSGFVCDSCECNIPGEQ